MRKQFLSLLCVLALCLSLLPVTALAADGDTVYVGGVALTSSESTPVYATTDDNGEVTVQSSYNEQENWQIKWDGSTLTLDGAKIKGGTSSESLGATVGIYAFNNSGGVSLNIALKGVNEIFDSSHGIWVYSPSTNAGNVTLTIEGEGSLNASGSSNGILVQSNSGNAALTIQNADVTAENSSSSGDGVTVRAGSSSSASLSVDGGSLTATDKNENGAGIRYTFGSSSSGSGKPSLTVSGNAMVKASGGEGGISDNSSTDIQIGVGDNSSGGIVFDGNKGTVYGSATLQENLTVENGQTLTIPDGASLTIGSGATLTNEGTVTTTDGGTLTNKGTINNSGTLPDDIRGTAPPRITTTSLAGGTVGTAYTATLAASGTGTITWSNSGDLPAGLTLDGNTGVISGTPTAQSTSNFTVTASNNGGSDSEQLSITIEQAVDTTAPTLTTGSATRTDEATATVTFTSSEAGTYYYAVVESGATEGTDVDISDTGATCTSGTNTINLNNLTGAGAKDIYIVAKDAANNVSQPLNMTIPDYVAPSYGISVDSASLNFGSVNVGYETAPTAQTVTITNTGNQSVTVNLPTSTNYTITAGTGFTSGIASLVPNDTAQFTVQPKTGLGVGTYSEAITVSGSDGASASLTASFTVSAVPVTSVTLNHNQASLYCNRTPNTLTLTATVAPDNATNKAVTWTSSDSAVATVDQNGVVTALARGTAVITATTADGGKTASCTVTVSRYSSGGGSSSSSTSLSDQAIDDIQDARPGDTVEITLRPGRTTLEREVFEELAGQDITLEIDAGDGVLWTVNGLDIPEDTRLHDLDLGVDLGDSDIPATVLNAVTGEIGTVQLSLAHDGQFGFTMTLSAPLGRDNADYWANLYWFNEGTEELEFQQAARIAKDGTAEFALDHASDYAIVIDDRSHEPVDLPFNDVPEGYWAYDAIQYVYGEGLMAGTSGSTFSPEGATTRGQIVTILWRLSGSPVVNYLMDFDDVDPAAYYAEAIRWATSEGIAGGYGNGSFGPNDPITREQLAVMLYQYAWNMGYDLSIGEDTNILSYADAFDVSEYAVSALQWACGAGIISGTGDGSTLSPGGSATRSQVAMILMRFCQEFVEEAN